MKFTVFRLSNFISKVNDGCLSFGILSMMTILKENFCEYGVDFPEPSSIVWCDRTHTKTCQMPLHSISRKDVAWREKVYSSPSGELHFFRSPMY